jgi:metallo-beta-lactamase class B
MTLRQAFIGILLTIAGCKSSKPVVTGFTSDQIVIEKVADQVYRHSSFLQTRDFGRVSCNGMIVVGGNEAIIFDTPVDDPSSAALLDWIRDSLMVRVKAVIPTHFHEDCVGGLNEFHKRDIPSYASKNTILWAAERKFPVPQTGFDSLWQTQVGGKAVVADFAGEGHTRDNIIGYFPSSKVMFGGCLVKEVGAGKGNLADANVSEWSGTIAKLKTKYPDMQFVIPGHGKSGGVELLDYTFELFNVLK